MTEDQGATTAEKIMRIIQETPGIRAKDIGQRLGLDKTTIDAVLRGALKGQITQDKEYGWRPKKEASVTEPTPPKELNTRLAKLCRYYLDCLNRDDQVGYGVKSLFLTLHPYPC